ncbi:L,D-transpeptidase family protein [Methylosinus sp. LW4]|uniref:L,D-transpeptidase family protein n=1 Tax=Methylosinus sp. LW4 TaxID=136993 RepID=UPI0003829230|nr:murein L,D-transpeptidase family protein [Methylosinus sp. LW4]
MPSKPSRPLLLAAALALSLVEIGVFVAFASRGPARLAETREAVTARRSNPFGALVQNLRGAIVETARQEEPAPSEEPPPAIAAAPSARPPSFLAALPPLRPAEPEAVLALPPVDAPLPPARPRNLAGVEPVATAETPAGTTALPPVAVSPPTQALALAAAPPNEPPPLTNRDDGNFRMGSAVYVRIFKKEGELELWRRQSGRFALYRTYPICKWSGHLGPKLKSGDYQSPEGFYSVSARQLNPNSHYHRAFDVGFPNAYDKQNGRTGGALMVHGSCKSVGCFAMTDRVIEEIYGMVEAALRGGQHEVPVHIFPFRMTDAALAKETQGDWTNLWSAPPEHQQWSGFWQNLKEGYDLFEQTGEPPTAYACGSRYAFGAAGGSCRRIAGW